MNESMTLRHLGGPTVMLSVGGLTLLTDPTFDPPGTYPLPVGELVKHTGPTHQPDQLGAIDAVLLSHDQHPDNLDATGLALLATASHVFSTPAASRRLDDVHGLAPWSTRELPRGDDAMLSVTAVPARHGPEGSESVLGEVTGFVLDGEGLPTVYVSGDNASLEVVAEIADRVDPIDLAILCVGAPKLPQVAGDHLLGLSAHDATTVAQLLPQATVVPVHTEGWSHFTESPLHVMLAFEKAGMSDRLLVLAPGRETRWG
jgi:L-ascorbate metabolism protein UlaG (beta-lactamase superfamily)